MGLLNDPGDYSSTSLDNTKTITCVHICEDIRRYAPVETFSSIFMYRGKWSNCSLGLSAHRYHLINLIQVFFCLITWIIIIWILRDMFLLCSWQIFHRGIPYKWIQIHGDGDDISRVDHFSCCEQFFQPLQITWILSVVGWEILSRGRLFDTQFIVTSV